MLSCSPARSSRTLLVLIVLSACVFQRPTNAAGVTTDLCQWTNAYLPKTVKPLGYDLVFEIGSRSPGAFKATTVAGSARIVLQASAATSCIVLQGFLSPMTYSNVRITQNGVTQAVSSVTVNEDLQYAILRFPASIAPDSLSTLEAQFAYPIAGVSTGAGILKGTYQDTAGMSWDIVFSQFQPAGARLAFPCFDEPTFKANFNITIVAPATNALVALSNMPKTNQYTRDDGKVVHVFDKTPLAPTYTIALVVGHLSNISKQCDMGQYGATTVSSWGVPESLNTLSLSVDVACAVLKNLSTLFQHGYDLPKLDQVAVPSFPKIGAMENWGLITYERNYLELDPTWNSVDDLDAMYVLISHEVTHQWFGNLITVSEWNWLWMQEGVAAYYESVGADVVLPQFHQYQSFPFLNTKDAFKADVGAKVSPLTVTPNHPLTDPNAQGAMFSPISYNKGAAILRMLRAYLNQGRLQPWNYVMRRRAMEQQYPSSKSLHRHTNNDLKHRSHLVGHTSRRAMLQQSNAVPPLMPAVNDSFIASLVQYFQSYSFTSVQPSDLWGTIENVTGYPVGSWMVTWTSKPHYPLISVKRDPNDPQQVIIRQQDIVNATNATLTQVACNASVISPDLWWVPINYLTQFQNDSFQWAVVDHTCEVRVRVPDAGWVLVNAGRYGYYQANYSEELWTDLTKAAGQGLLDPVDLAGLLFDSCPTIAGAPKAFAPITAFLNLTTGLRHTLVPFAWDFSKDPLITLMNYISFAANADSALASCTPQLTAYIVELAATIAPSNYSSTGSTSMTFTVKANTDPMDLRRVRADVLALRLAAGDSALAQKGAALVKGSSDIHPDVELLARLGAALSGDTTAWQALRTLYESDPSIVGLPDALFSGTSPAIIQLALDYLLNTAFDTSSIPSMISKQGAVSPTAFSQTLTWLDQNMQDLISRFDGSTHLSTSLASALKGLMSHVHDSALLPTVRSLASQYSIPNLVALAQDALSLHESLRGEVWAVCDWVARK